MAVSRRNRGGNSDVRLPLRLDVRWVTFVALTTPVDAELQARLRLDDLPALAPAELSAIRSHARPPKRFVPNDPHHEPSARLLGTLGIADAFRHPEVRDNAIAILRHPRVREVVECALLAGVPPRVIARLVTQRLGFATTLEAVDFFSSMTFDTEAFPRSELRFLVRQRVEARLRRHVGADAKALQRALASDARVAAASLNKSPVSWAAASLQLGLGVPKPDLARTVSELEHVALLRSTEAILRGQRDGDRRALAFAAVAEKARAISETIAEPTASLAHAMRFRVTQDARTLPNVHELVAAGDEVSHVDVGPTEQSDQLPNHRGADPPEEPNGSPDTEDGEPHAMPFEE